MPVYLSGLTGASSLAVVRFGASRRGGRVVEGARLESVYTETYRGFESLLLRQKLKEGPVGPFFDFEGVGGVDDPSGSTNSAFGRVWTRSRKAERPVRGESGEGSADRVYPSFSAKI
jgi:hypothetical protein